MKTKKVMAIGNAMVDLLFQIGSDEVLNRLNLPKGSMTLIDKEKMMQIKQELAVLTSKKSTGGSAANTIHGLANLGLPTAFIGKVGNDDLGHFFANDMKQKNVDIHLGRGQEETGRVTVLISPDSERTFAVYLGAAQELDTYDLKPEYFIDSPIFHLEGYLVINREFTVEVLKMAKANQCSIGFDLASHNVVTQNKAFVEKVIEEYVDIVFANEEEAKMFAGYSDPVRNLDVISKHCQIAVVKLGSQGSLIKHKDLLYRIEPVPARAVDTTGAGDLYATGFYFGMVNGLTCDQCGRIASLISAQVVETIGAKMDESSWRQIKDKIRKIAGAIV